MTQISGFEAAPEASGTLVQPLEGAEAFLIVRNLPRLASNQEFHVWRITGDVPLNVGAFPSGDRSEQQLTLAANFSGADAIGVSIERKGSKPTKPSPGAIVLLATL